MLDTERLSRSSFEQACTEFSYYLDEALFANLTGRSASDHRAILITKYGNAGINFDIRWKEIYLSRLDVQVPVMPGAKNFLKQAQKRGYKLAVGTSSHTDKAIELLCKAQLEQYFSVIVGSDKVQFAKPSPDIYLLIMEELQVTPKVCAIIEDSENGITAALRSGVTNVISFNKKTNFSKPLFLGA